MSCECCNELKAELQRIRQETAGLRQRVERNTSLIEQVADVANRALVQSSVALTQATAAGVAAGAAAGVAANALAQAGSALSRLAALATVVTGILAALESFVTRTRLQALENRVAVLERFQDVLMRLIQGLAARINRNSDKIGIIESGLAAVRRLADRALSKANQAFDIATGAREKANRAFDIATDARAKANRAFDIATDARAKANRAFDIATDARAKANQAQLTADNALARADSARQMASSALSEAITAARAANAAYQRASEAIRRADNAQATANNALARADSARQMASNALSEAITAARVANAALLRAGEAIDRSVENRGLIDLIEAVLEELKEQSAKILLRVGGDEDFPLSLPSSLTDEGNSQRQIESLPQLGVYLLEQIDAVTGQYPISIEIEDTDPVSSGNQSQTIELSNQSEAVAELFGLAYEANTNSELAINILFRLIPEIVAAKNSSLTSQDYVKAVVNWLGFRTKNVGRKVDSNFSPLKADSLPNFLKESQYEIEGVEDDDPHTLVEWVQQLKYAAALMKASVFRGSNITDAFSKEVESAAGSDLSEEASEDWETFIDALNSRQSNLTDINLHPRPRATSVEDVLNPETILPTRSE